MKRLFPIISVILTAALLIGVFAFVPFSVSADSKPTFVVENVEAEPGAKNVAVNVSVKNNPGIASILLDIGYDKTALTLKNFSYNSVALAGTMTVPFNASVSQPSLSMVSGTSNINGDFLFATLYFDVADNASGKQSITLSYDENNVYDIAENNIKFAVVNGSINLGGEVTPTNPTKPSDPGLGNSPAFVVDNVKAEPGAKNVAVNVSVKNNPGIASILLDIGYDKTALTLKNFSYNSVALAGTMTVPFNASVSQPSLSMVSGTSNINGDFLFATLYFDVADNASGQQNITLSYDENNVYDIAEDNIKFAVVNGSIVLGGEVTPTEPVDPTNPINPDSGNSPAFVVDNVEAEPGAKNVAVNVFVKNNPGIASILLDIGYDKSVLTLKAFSYNSVALAGTMTVPFNASASQPSLSMVSGTSNINGDFLFATLYFDVADNASGKQNITLSYDENNVYNIDEDNIKFVVMNGSVTAKEIAHVLIGDANGDGRINIRDVTAIQRHIAEVMILTGEGLAAADVNGDGTVTVDDATLLQMFLAEYDVVLGK